MKTNAEWLNMLPDKYKWRALNNADNIGVLGNTVDSLLAALFAFPWDLTREGYEYWKDVYDRVERCEFD
jgi:hypothetical protein